MSWASRRCSCCGATDRASELVAYEALQAADRAFVPLVEGPLLDPPRAQQAGLRQHLEMLAHGRLADAELLGDQHAAHAILDQVAVDLRAEMARWILQPFQDLQPP